MCVFSFNTNSFRPYFVDFVHFIADCAALESELESLKQMGEDFTKMETELSEAKTQVRVGGYDWRKG